MQKSSLKPLVQFKLQNVPVKILIWLLSGPILAHLVQRYNMIYCHPFLLAHLAKGNMTFLPSLFKFKSSTMKPLNQIKPNLAEIVLGWSPFRIMADSPVRHIQYGCCYWKYESKWTFIKILNMILLFFIKANLRPSAPGYSWNTAEVGI